MKNLLVIAAIASVMFSCNGVTDTNNDKATADMQTELLKAKHEAEIQKLRSELDVQKAKQAAIDSMQSVAIAGKATAAEKSNRVAGDSKVTQRVNDDWTPRERTSSSTDAYKPSVKTAPVAQTQKKKGLHTPAKGAIIGGAVGAATGAIVSKKKVQGAILGGAVGAGAGTVTGILIDKQKAKKEASRTSRTPDYSYANY
ncbi:hypothetical protein [Telluribacter sp. SYSU D00476]|uniref:hypothetical protein n=1 Tax=Telluribacter sp. SYSU D00476 TaxID=2811430 RepID=UPI001FF45E17|nr:hypothetical protein [Telluribacter sp. SYSU D00476]